MSFVLVLFGVYPCMAIDVSGEYNGGFLPDISYTADPILVALGNPIKCHEEVFLQPIIPPERSDIFPP